MSGHAAEHDRQRKRSPAPPVRLSGRSLLRGLAPGLLISAVLIAILVAQVDVGESLRAIRRLELQPVLLAAALSILTMVLRPLRWRQMFSPACRPTFRASFAVLSIGNFANNLLPARGGDVLRCALIDRQPSLRGLTRALGTLGLEKVLDGLALLAVITASLLFIQPSPWLVRLAVAGMILFGGAFGLLLALQRWPRRLRRWTLALLLRFRLPGAARRADRMLRGLVQGLDAIASAPRLSWLFLLTALNWALEAGIIAALAAGLGFGLTLADSAVVGAVLGLAMMIPAAPGFIGTYEFFAVATLALFGLGKAEALALALVLHAWVYLATIGSGLLGLAIHVVRDRPAAATVKLPA